MYNRVIPRDLFNDGNLLTCYGHLYIALEQHGLQDCMVYSDDEAFNIHQDIDGNTFLTNVTLYTIHHEEIFIFRPINGRTQKSLLFIDVYEDMHPVFIQDELNEKLLNLICN